VPTVENANAFQHGHDCVIIDESGGGSDGSDGGDGRANVKGSEPEDSGEELSPFFFFGFLYNQMKRLVDRLSKDWKAPIYALFEPEPEIGYENGRRFHIFRCAAKGCKQSIRRYLDKGDAKSTSNLHKHAKICWGGETVATINGMGSVDVVRDTMKTHKSGSILSAFKRKVKGSVTYSHRQHTKTETR
jgi:hypothetical protein